MKIFAIHDSKSEMYSNISVHPATGHASRAFQDAVNSGQGVLSSHPEDFTLFELANFDEKTGKIVPLTPAKVVCNGVDVKLVQDAA